MNPDKLFQELGISHRDIDGWQRKTFVVKAGGEVLDSAHTLHEDLCALGAAEKAVIYGGQKEISAAMQASGYKPRFTADGLRVTDEAAMKIFLDVAAGIGRRLAAGTDGEVMLPSVLATKKLHLCDLGYVGEPIRPTDEVSEALKKGRTAFLAPVGKAHSGEGYNGLWNCNGDAVAGVAAVYLNPEEMVFMTNVDGVMINGETEAYLSIKEAEQAIEKGYVTGGMQQKVSAALMALREGATDHVHIVNGLEPHALLYAVTHRPFHGTVVYR